MTPMSDRKLRIGVIGLGRAFTIMLPTFTGDARVQLVAAADPRADARERFAAEFGGNAYAEAEALCAADPAITSGRGFQAKICVMPRAVLRR